MGPIVQLILLVAILAFLKLVLGLPVSIIGSLLLTLALSAIATAVHSGRRG